MKRIKKSLLRVAERFDLPQNVIAHLPQIQVNGNNEVSIDLQQGLLAYSKTDILVAVPMGKIAVIGKNLHIRLMREKNIVIGGTILKLEFLMEDC